MNLHDVLFDETRRRILSMTAEKDMTVTEIARELGLTKATVSHHVKLLHSRGFLRLVREEVHGNLIRRYYRSVFGDVKPLNQAEEEIISRISADIDDYQLLRALLRSMSVVNLQMGNEMLLKKLGFDIGYHILADFVEEGVRVEEGIAGMWEKFRLGEVVETGRGVFIVEECYLCEGLPVIGQTYCKSDEGIIEGILLKKTGERYRVKEISCWGTGSKRCTFEIHV